MARAQCSDILTELERWYGSERGGYLLRATREALQARLDTAFGYHLLQLGLHSAKPLMAGSRINHKIFLAERSGDQVGVVAHVDELPLESDSVDTVIVHHALEFAHKPHRMLSEIQRVLTPQGQLYIVAFNPVSLIGAEARIRGLLRDPLWQGFRPITTGRLTDWLHLLNCEVHETHYIGGLTPLGKGRLYSGMHRMDSWMSDHKLPVGGLCLVHATKQVVGMHSTRRRSQLAPGALIGLVPKPRPTPVPLPVAPTPRQHRSNDEGNSAA